MVNKREKNLLYNSDKRLSSFFIFLILTFSFYYFLLFPLLFRFNFVVSEQNVHILSCRYILAELSLLFWTFLSGTLSPGGGGARHPVHPPLRMRQITTITTNTLKQYTTKQIQKSCFVERSQCERAVSFVSWP